MADYYKDSYPYIAQNPEAPDRTVPQRLSELEEVVKKIAETVYQPVTITAAQPATGAVTTKDWKKLYDEMCERANGLEDRIQQLEDELADAENERDDLAVQVEDLKYKIEYIRDGLG